MTLAVASLLGGSFAARAGVFERLVMPGPLAAVHAKAEADCKNCHSAFEEAAEDELCLECHEPVALDLTGRVGFHGRLPQSDGRSCRTCHGDHRGRDADILGLDPDTFSHAKTDFALEGAHLRVPCASCHAEEDAHRDAPADCRSCHGDDDVHQGAMKADCGDCHSTSAWKNGKFDHSKTDFALVGRHGKVACALCHPSEIYEKTPTDCASCHMAQDVHARRFGADCDQCHSPEQWKTTRFDHDAQTDFRLTGAHRTTRCDACHARPGAGPANTLKQTCISCHRSDDEHDGQNGADCGRCHGTGAWKETSFDHARESGWPLRGAHSKLDCGRCHRAPAKEVKLESTCISCHAPDDAHRGQLGKDCGACHAEASWLAGVRFDHDMSRFPLLGLHAVANCSDCHAAATFHDAERNCSACHAAQDVHERKLGADCARCHNPNGWEVWRFDHDHDTRFALHGAHRGIDCLACHTSPVSGKIHLSSNCGDCHARDDAHRGSFGTRCGDCHSTTTWKGARIPR